MSDGKLHSKLGASSYDRWSACPGSVAASVGVPNISSVYAEEGTKAHDVAANILLGKGPKEPVEDEMAEAVNVYLDHIAELRGFRPSFEAVEQKLDLSSYHPELFGTADYVCYFPGDKTLHVVDYKHGRGIPVEVKNSKQLMYYGLGALHMNAFPIDKVILTIVQPRCYHPDGVVRSWETGAIEMLDFAAQLIDDAVATEKTNAPLVTGDHCRFCPAQPTCPAIETQALSIATAAFSDVEKYDPDKLSKTLTAIPQIEAWCKSVREFAYQQASLGNTPPGWKLVDKRATRKWADEMKPAELGQWLDLDMEELYESKLKSPASVEKLLPKEKKKLLEMYTVRESSGKSLVPIFDDRKPVAGAIETMFGNE